MKKICYKSTFLLCLLTLLSCSNVDDDDKKSNDDLKLDINFVKSSTGSNLSNLQVGDTITFEYKITSSLTSTKDYIINPKINNPNKHQIIGEDYEIVKDNKSLPFISTKDKEGTFQYLVKKPGNFDNYFSVSTKNSTNETVTSKEYNIFFNAVKIVAYSYTIQLQNGTTTRSSTNKFFNKIFIDTGNKENDNYLVDLNYSVKFLHLENKFTKFQKNKSLDFHDPQQYKGAKLPSVTPTTITSITFSVPLNNSNSTIIEYKNIPVQSMDRQQSWGENGNNNF